MRPIDTRKLAAAGLAGLLLLATARGASAQGWIEPVERWPGQFRVERVRSDVSVTIDAERRVAYVEVEEVFRNGSRVLMEGDYLYPIPTGSRIHGLLALHG